jgi:AcrR family transcriptional regulator
MTSSQSPSTNEQIRSFMYSWEPDDCRNPSLDTRYRILIAAFEEIHRVGYQAASISHILQRTGVTKGALYHHFPSKKALGYAVLDELILTKVQDVWITPLADGNPVDVMIRTIEMSGEEITDDDIRLGCPLNNLSQEMSPIDEGFRKRIEGIYSTWREGIASGLNAGKKKGQIKADVDTEAMAIMLVAGLEGCIGAAKSAQSKQVLLHCGGSLIYLLHCLKITADRSDKPETKKERNYSASSSHEP